MDLVGISTSKKARFFWLIRSEEKKIDVFEELGLYSLMMSRLKAKEAKEQDLFFCHNYRLYNCCTKFSVSLQNIEIEFNLITA